MALYPRLGRGRYQKKTFIHSLPIFVGVIQNHN